MKLVLFILAAAMLINAAGAIDIRPDQINNSLPFPSIEMDEDANITIDGGWLLGAWFGGEVRTLSYAGVIVTLSPWLIQLDYD